MNAPQNTDEDRRHLRQFVNDGGGGMHPFTAARWTALGWVRQTSRGDALLGINASYEWTASGLAEIHGLT